MHPTVPLPAILLNAHWQMHLTPRGHFAIKDAVASLAPSSRRFVLLKVEGGEFVNADGSVPSLMIGTLAGDVIKANAVIFDRNKMGPLYLCHIPKGSASPRTDAGIKRFMRTRGMAI